VLQPDRVTIPMCIGCGGMRVYESCETTCSERKLEIVSADDHDRLTDVANARRARIEAFECVLEQLTDGDPRSVGWQDAFQALQSSARSSLRRARTDAATGSADLPPEAESLIVWRCPQCGGLDAPQECIGVCVWRPFEWVNSRLYEVERSRAEFDRERETSLLELLRRIAFVTPRNGEWERNWRALQSQAQLTRAAATGGGW